MHPVILVEGSSATINYRMWTVMIVYVHVHDLVNVHILYLLLFSVWRDLQLPLSCIWQSDGWGSGRRIRVRERRRRGGRWRRGGGGGGLLLNWFFFSNLLLTISFTMFGCLWWLYFTRFKELLCTNIFNLNWWLGWI